MKKMGSFTIQTWDEVKDRYLGEVGTSKRDAFDEAVAESVREYELNEAQRRAIEGDKYIEANYYTEIYEESKRSTHEQPLMEAELV